MKKGGRRGIGRRKGGKSWLGPPWCTRPLSQRVSAVKCIVGSSCDCGSTTHRVTPRGGPLGPRGCPRAGGWPGWKPPSAPPAAGRSSLRPAAPSTACWAVEEALAGAGGSEVAAREEGRLMAGPHDTIRGAGSNNRTVIIEQLSRGHLDHC